MRYVKCAVRARLCLYPVIKSSDIVEHAVAEEVRNYLLCYIMCLVGNHAELHTFFAGGAQKLGYAVISGGLVFAVKSIIFHKHGKRLFLIFLPVGRQTAFYKLRYAVADKIFIFIDCVGRKAQFAQNVICAVPKVIDCVQKCTVKVENKCLISHRNTSFLATIYNII